MWFALVLLWLLLSFLETGTGQGSVMATGAPAVVLLAVACCPKFAVNLVIVIVPVLFSAVG